MTGAVVVDANLLLLLVVGSADTRYIRMHKNLESAYDETDFELLGQTISLFSDIVLIPHVLTEVSNLSRQIGNPVRSAIQVKLNQLIETTPEVMFPSRDGARRNDFLNSVSLTLCFYSYALSARSMSALPF